MLRTTSFTVRAVLFDLDGVLVNSHAPVERQWRIWAREHNQSEEELLKVAHGHRSIETIQHFAPDLDLEAEAEEMERREIEDTEGLKVMPGAKELLESLPPDRWAIATSGGRALATSRLRFAKLPIPRVLISADDVKRGKPDPEPYLTAAAKLGFSPHDCIVIEDAPYGIQAAHSGGMQAIAVAGTYPIEQLHGAEFLVRNVGEIRAKFSGERVTLICTTNIA